MRVASWLLSLFLVTCTAYSQQPAVAPPNSDAAGSPTEPSLHNDAKLLVQLMGVRQRMTDGRDKSVQAGKDAMVKNSPTINPAFVEEWGKRMAARTNVEDYVNLFVLVYEKHFNDAEINELIQVQRDVKDSTCFCPFAREAQRRLSHGPE